MKNKKGKGFFTWQGVSLVMLILALCFAIGCAANESQPVVTDDDLTPFSVSSVPSEEGGGEVTGESASKNYAYDWPPAYMDEWEKDVRESGAYSDVLQDPDATPADQMDAMIDLYRSEWEEELALDPAVPPQEAANRAGRVFEELYGVDLSQEMLQLSCYESDSDMLYHIGGGGTLRKIWLIELRQKENNMPSMKCTIDATTGEMVYMNYVLPDTEMDAMMQTPADSCYSMNTNRWDEADPACAQTLKAMAETARQLLSGSMLTDGAAITDVQTELAERASGDSGIHELRFYFVCENGRTYRLTRKPPANPFSRYDFSGFPLRGYTFCNDTYMQG